MPKFTRPQDIIATCNIDTLSAISTRRSIRAYKNELIKDPHINTILNAGFCAPSARNRRPWHFIVVKDRLKLSRLANSYIYGRMISHASCCIIVCADTLLQEKKELLIADCSASTQNMLLAAHSLGIGAVWCAVIQDSPWMELIVKEFNLPKEIVPISAIPLGFPKEIPSPPDRFDASKVHIDTW